MVTHYDGAQVICKIFEVLASEVMLVYYYNYVTPIQVTFSSNEQNMRGSWFTPELHDPLIVHQLLNKSGEIHVLET